CAQANGFSGYSMGLAYNSLDVW
nr:immunoglobulin heavy chain junction region [Macaca mulatta]MOW47983.1 immunoglobulin heavy chain junction region [Macaca mulatta]MOW48721.1 immunoglobulin heavy chain junction region [Macaca mulatta]MOW49062.1 immunoglobulin heavy chain junction region [Macaca mulatta]MOW51274.1 immunoglobulin heavy chain junction region [Macaca mulatta]